MFVTIDSVRIAVFIKSTTFHPHFGGLETQNRQLCEGLATRGHKVIVFAPKGDVSQESIEENRVVYKFVPGVYRLGVTQGANNWVNTSVEAFKTIHNSVPFDIVISQSSAALGIIKNKVELGVKVLAIAHGSILGEFKTRFSSITGIKDVLALLPDTLFTLRVFFGRQRQFIHGANKIVAVSSFVKTKLIEETFAPEEKFVVINNGIKPVSLSLQNKSNDFIFVGRLIKSKGVFDLVKLFASKELQPYTLRFVGDGDDREALEHVVTQQRLQNISFNGQVAPDQVAQLLAQSKVFVFPTNREEGFPMVLAEAMFAGLPIVAFNKGGVSDAIVHEQTGYLVDYKNMAVFKQQLVELAENSALRNRMSQNALTRASECFSADAMLDKYEQVIKEVLL